ncbi:MFS transporter [Mycolicibacterium agri]|uniref:MFS transporter n=1 Tax=Mycolicibacterium agri TaxID=36811 RepID=A0A2A7NEL6_MYCAG|nr:MFS transporter [Mycolicibacterium agri]PEG42269.1 MFS transporter [Mycolicibacterium agri]
MDVSRPPGHTAGRSQVLSWALWDVGATGVNAIVVTFVFSVYLTGTVGDDLPSATTPQSWLFRALALSGLVVALLAPVTGIWVDAPWRRRRVLAVLTGMVVLLTSTMSLIRDDHRYLWPGLVLLACTAACSELATVPYNAMLRGLSTPTTSGRVSGFGLGMGYFGSVTLLLIVYVMFISGDGDTRGLLGLSIADGQNVRAAMLMTAAWFTLFALPVFIAVPHPEPEPGERRAVGFFGAYKKLWREVVAEWHRDRNIVYYLLASAVFRDGLAGIFAFGAVLGVSVYGISDADVLLFGISASVIAALGALFGGLIDDRLGSKPVILGSLASLITVGCVLMALSGPVTFWVCGLMLCLFIGPTLSSARTLMLRMSLDGKEGVAFGLYTTTGRAVSFLAPAMISLFIDWFGAVRAGTGGLMVVLGVGLIAMAAVHAPHRVTVR